MKNFDEFVVEHPQWKFTHMPFERPIKVPTIFGLEVITESGEPFVVTGNDLLVAATHRSNKCYLVVTGGTPYDSWQELMNQVEYYEENLQEIQ